MRYRATLAQGDSELVAFVDGQDASSKDIVRYYTYTVEETAVTL